LITPAVYDRGAKRRNVNVKSWAGWAALDIDDYDCSPDDALKPFKKYRFVCYSTASSTKAHPKFRIILPLTDAVQADKIKHFWYALNTELNSIGDPQTKDLSRMYYTPGQYPDAFNFIFSHTGEGVLKPSDLLAKHTYVESNPDPLSNLPPAVQQEILNYRQNKLTNRDKTWTSYEDCPYVPKQQLAEYRTLQGEGWYRQLYKIMTSIAFFAIKDQYPITANEIESMIRSIDADNGGWYKNRPIALEAQRAITYAMRNSVL
jgi:hypothetical protein